MMFASAAFLMKSAALWMLTPRSRDWPALRRWHLRREPVCQWCGGTEELQVHHIVPYFLDKALELDPFNLLTMCMAPGLKCHYEHGHMGRSWLVYDPDIRQKCEQRRK